MAHFRPWVDTPPRRDQNAAMDPAHGLNLLTARLTLRPFAVEDAARVLTIETNWNVMRMLRAATFPATLESTHDWLASHETEWRAGTAYRFALIMGGALIGRADVDEIANGRGVLGYWLDEAAWGQGLATEAAGAVTRFALDTLDLNGLNSSHASDNPASGKVLRKLGFRRAGEIKLWSNPRGHEITHLRYALERGEWRAR